MEGHETSSAAGGWATATAAGAVETRDAVISGPPPIFADKGGPVIDRARLWLVFWGSGWPTAPPPADRASIAFDVLQILNSSYLSRLHQYRPSIRYQTPDDYGIVEGVVTVASPVGSSPADPPTVYERFRAQQLSRTMPTLDGLTGLIENLLLAGLVAPPVDPDRLYVVFMPEGVGASVDGKHIWGLHYAVEMGYPEQVHIAYVGNSGNREWISQVFAHELAEAITDPEGTAVKATDGRSCGDSNPDHWCEISDMCQEVVGTTSTGVAVQGYWSVEDQRCIIPGT